MPNQDNHLEQMFGKIFSDFMDYMYSDANQKQLGVASDLLQDMLYTYVRSPDGIHIGRTILWRGCLLPDGCDAQINLEYDVEGSIHHQIRLHKHQDSLNEIYRLADPESWILK